MFLPKEAPEHMTEKLQNGAKEEKTKTNFDYFNDLALYRGFLDCFWRNSVERLSAKDLFSRQR